MPVATNHQDPLTRYYANHPQHLAQIHRAFLGGISDEAQAFIQANPHLAHHPDMENIRNLPKSEHLQAVRRLRAQESSGPESESDSANRRDNKETDLALGDKAKRTAGHARSKSARY